GYLSDSYVKTLMKYCKAFIQPSLSEGFGIPPLEALSVGAEIIVSNATCLPEIYGNTAHYIDPLDYDNIDLEAILSTPVEKPDAILEKFSWDHAAQSLASIVEPLLS
nr:glycosyltransferase [Butyrivibrio sp.]